MSSDEVSTPPAMAQARDDASAAPDPASASRRAGARVGLALVLLATLVAYANSFRAPFVFDDGINIELNPIVRDLSLFATPWRVDERFALPHHYGYFTRYFAFLSFALDHRLWGSRVAGYHLTSLLIHLAAIATLFAFTLRTLRLPAFDGSRVRGREEAAALITAGLFALHPLQTQAVTYLVQRMASLAALLCLVSIWAFLRGATAPDGARGRRYLAVSVLASAMAMATKQNAIVFPLVVVLFDRLFLPGAPGARRRRLLPLVATMAIAPLLHLVASTTYDATAERLQVGAALSAAPSRAAYVATQPRVLVRYLAMLVVPTGQAIHHELELSGSLAEPRSLAASALLAGLVALGVFLASRRRGDATLRLAGFGIVWFFAAHAVESSGVKALDPMFEHRMYLPSAGLFLAAATTGAALVPERLRRAALAALLVVMALSALATSRRNAVWRSEARLWSEVTARYPASARGHLNLGEALLDARRADEAAREFERVLELEPSNQRALTSLGVVARARRDPAGAERHFRRAVEIDPTMWVAWINLGDLALARGDRVEAARCYRQAQRFEELSRIAERKLAALGPLGAAATAPAPAQ